MTHIRWTTEAANQLEVFVSRIRDDNPEAARALAQSLLDCIAQLETFPGLGRPGERTGTRELISSPYVIVYRVKVDVSEILHIWHGAQDWRS